MEERLQSLVTGAVTESVLFAWRVCGWFCMHFLFTVSRMLYIYYVITLRTNHASHAIDEMLHCVSNLALGTREDETRRRDYKNVAPGTLTLWRGNANASCHRKGTPIISVSSTYNTIDAGLSLRNGHSRSSKAKQGSTNPEESPVHSVSAASFSAVQLD